MRIEHIAIWVQDLEGMKAFYERYFEAKAGDLYVNPNKNFQSYFLSFSSGCRLELMYKPEIPENSYRLQTEVQGITHFAFTVGSKKAVDLLTEKIRSSGWTVAGEPRTTGDGYYESVILDPEGNRVEIVA